ncbi:MAG: DUF4870 domain-containing protein [Propionicimonas sp.]
MTDQTPESTDPRPSDETVVEAELVTEPATDDPIDQAEVDASGSEPESEPADVVEADIVEAELVEPVSLDLGAEEAAAPTGTDFDVVTAPHAADATPAGDFDLAAPVAEPEPTPAADPVPSVQPDATAVPDPAPAPVPPAAPAAPTGGSFLDLPPLPDLNYPAPAAPPVSPYPPPAASYPQAADYPKTDYAPYPGDYSEQVAGQAYGHGAPAPAPQPQPAPVSPYGTPTGFAVQPYQTAPGDTTMASLAHWGSLVADVLSGTALGFLVPLVIMLTKGKDDPFVRAHAVESLNFNLTVILGMIASVILVFAFVGIIGLIAIPIVAIILQILASIAASRGEAYRYPISIRFVK